MKRYKIKAISYYDSQPKMGLTVPKEIAMINRHTKFTVELSGTSIVYTSGPEPTKTQIENFQYEDSNIIK